MIITNWKLGELIDLTQQVKSSMGYEDNIIIVNDENLKDHVKIIPKKVNKIIEKNNKQKKIIAIAFKNKKGESFIYYSKFIILADINMLIDIIRHELAHLITGENDEGYNFQMFLEVNNIPKEFVFEKN